MCPPCLPHRSHFCNAIPVVLFLGLECLDTYGKFRDKEEWSDEHTELDKKLLRVLTHPYNPKQQLIMTTQTEPNSREIYIIRLVGMGNAQARYLGPNEAYRFAEGTHEENHIFGAPVKFSPEEPPTVILQFIPPQHLEISEDNHVISRQEGAVTPGEMIFGDDPSPETQQRYNSLMKLIQGGTTQ